MSGKTLAARAKQKHDIETNWQQAVNFIPYAGEVIVYDADANHDHPRFKVGDGSTVVSSLPFATGDNIGAIRINRTINAATGWTQDTRDGETVYVHTYPTTGTDGAIDPSLDIVEFVLDDPNVQTGNVEITTYSGYMEFVTNVQPTEDWNAHVTLVTRYCTNNIEYPKIATVRVRLNIAGTSGWTSATPPPLTGYDAEINHGAASDTSNLKESMSLIEWEPIEGKDFPWNVEYTTGDGYVIIHTDEIITADVDGYATFGVDSGSIDVTELGPNFVKSVNGRMGDVTVPEAVESIDDLDWIIPVQENSTDTWTASTWHSAITSNNHPYETSTSTPGECYETCVAAVSSSEDEAVEGDRFVCTACKGNPSPLYCIPGYSSASTKEDGKMLIQTATAPTTDVVLSGYIRQEADVIVNQYKHETHIDDGSTTELGASDFTPTSAVTSVGSFVCNTKYGNTTMSVTNITLASSISSGTATKIFTVPTSTINVIGQTYITGLALSGSTLCTVLLDTYSDSDPAIYLTPKANLSSGATVDIPAFTFPVTFKTS